MSRLREGRSLGWILHDPGIGAGIGRTGVNVAGPALTGIGVPEIGVQMAASTTEIMGCPWEVQTEPAFIGAVVCLPPVLLEPAPIWEQVYCGQWSCWSRFLLKEPVYCRLSGWSRFPRDQCTVDTSLAGVGSSRSRCTADHLARADSHGDWCTADRCSDLASHENQSSKSTGSAEAGSFGNRCTTNRTSPSGSSSSRNEVSSTSKSRPAGASSQGD